MPVVIKEYEMPDLNRRNFLHILGATGFAPLVPTSPAQAAVATSSASTSKALWASLYAKSGSKAEFVNFTRNLGLSKTAIQGVSARSIGVRVAASSLAQPLPQPSVANQTRSSSEGLMRVRAKVKDTLEKYFTDLDDDHEELTTTEHGVEELSEEAVVKES